MVISVAGKMVVDKEKTIRLLREAILQLCRVSLMGSFEVDGIICISPGNCEDEHQLVVKVHEQVSEESIEGTDVRDKKRQRDVQSSKAISAKFNDHEDNSLETTNETMSTWKNSGSDANSWTSDFAGCISKAGWKQVDKMLKAPTSRRLLAPCHNHEEIQELSIKKTVRKIEDNFYFSCKRCAIAFTSKPALENHLEQCNQRSGRCVYVDPLQLEEGEYEQKMLRKRKQRKPLKGFGEAASTDKQGKPIDSNNHEVNPDFVQPGQFPCMSDRHESDDVQAERESVAQLQGELHESLSSRANESSLNCDDVVMSMKSEQTYSCQLCGVEFSDFNLSNIHYRTVHSLYACAYCHEKFSRKEELDVHLSVHADQESFDCLLCGLSLTQRCELVAHHLQVHGIVMEGCDAMDLLVEPSSTTSVEQQSADQMAFPKIEDCINRELAEISANSFLDPLVQGLSCFEATPSTQNKTRQGHGFASPHARRVANSMAYAAKLQRSQDCRDRMSFGGDDEKVYECDKCRELIRGTNVYQMHCKKFHRRTPCLHCGKTFSQKGNMERHMRLHTGIKPYRCHLCRRSFSRKEALLGHISQDHAGHAIGSGSVF